MDSKSQVNKYSNPVIFIVGQTASGKSDLALHLAQIYNGVVVNCDSVQVYRGLYIGSAQPSEADKKLIPHYLFDYVEYPREMTAGEYRRDFFEFARKFTQKNNSPIFVVGGTGFYFQALEKGMYPTKPVDEALMQKIENELKQIGGASKLHQELTEKDVETAKKISVNDHYRLARAVEIIRSTGKSVSQIKIEHENSREEFPFRLLKIGIQTEIQDLKKKVQKRTHQMLSSGLLEEVQIALKEGKREWAPLKSVGYKECVEYIEGINQQQSPHQQQVSLETLEIDIVQNTMKLAKKQKTWFQRDHNISWLKGSGPESRKEAEVLVSKFIENA